MVTVFLWWRRRRAVQETACVIAAGLRSAIAWHFGFFATVACFEGPSCSCPLCCAAQVLWLTFLLRSWYFFKCFKSNTITIFAKEGDSQDSGTTLKLYAPLTGPKALVLPAKDNSMHIKSWSFEVFWEVVAGRGCTCARDCNEVSLCSAF